jgi:O-succinylbenzoate synthase
LPELPYACGLGTVPLLSGDLTADPLVPVDGHLDVRRVAPDAAKLAALAADEESTTWWLERMAAAQAVLGG